MKVLHINRNYISNSVHQKLFEYLDHNGVSGTAFVPISKQKDEKEFVITPNENVVIERAFEWWDSFFYYKKQKNIYTALINKIDPSSFDIAHAYTLFTDGNIAYTLKKQYGIPFVVAIRNTDVNDFFKKLPWLRSKGIEIMLNANAIFFLSETYKREVFEKYVPLKYIQLIEKKSFIIPNGIDAFWMDNKLNTIDKANSNDVIDVLYVGRVNKNKNLINLQKALSVLRNRGYKTRFTCIGEVEDKKTYKSMMAFDYTDYYCAMPKEELIYHYRSNDIFAMVSHTETFGVVYIEAISQNLPVVYTRGQGFDGQFPDGFVGFAADDNDINSIANSIEKTYLNRQKIRNQMVNAVDLFSWDILADKYIAIYSEIINNNSVS